MGIFLILITKPASYHIIIGKKTQHWDFFYSLLVPGILLYKSELEYIFISTIHIPITIYICGKKSSKIQKKKCFLCSFSTILSKSKKNSTFISPGSKLRYTITYNYIYLHTSNLVLDRMAKV